MAKDSNSGVICLCPLEGIIDIITKKWALLVINEIGNHKRIRYNDLMNELQPISPKTLADTLKELKNNNLVKREPFNEIPPRVDYTLTRDGDELGMLFFLFCNGQFQRRGQLLQIVHVR